MSERWCECPGHQSRDFRELTDFYSTHFVPTGWRLEYTTLLEREERRTLYITGECSQCGGFMRTGEDRLIAQPKECSLYLHMFTKDEETK